MPEEVMEQLFEPFFTTKPEGHGTGLGLATVYGIVKQSGGHVFVDSTPGAGTTFRVLIPRASAESADVAEKGRLAGDGTGGEPGRVVLLVEDDQAVRGVARRILDRAGYEVLEATNGDEALRIVESRSPSIDLVISDVIMPDLGGIALQRQLLDRDPGIKVILMSGYSEAEVRGEIRELGGAFLPKPFTPAALRQCVRRVLSDETGPRDARTGGAE